jgi:two-component system CheB/CheR fusion protein
VIRVRDTGIGIAPALLSRVFEPFVRGGLEASPTAAGLGLGLALVKSFVEQHGGTVAAVSEGPNRGSEFIVRLPRTPTGAPKAPLVAAEVATPPPEVRTLLVLVVDDQPDAAQSLARLVESWGHQTSIAPDGVSALNEVEHNRFDVLLLDIELPGMDGYEVARRLRERYGADLRIIALTGFGQRDRWEHEQSALLDHYLTKPVAPEELRALLQG